MVLRFPRQDKGATHSVTLLCLNGGVAATATVTPPPDANETATQWG